MNRKSEQQHAEEWVQGLIRGLEILHPLDRESVLSYLKGRIQAIKIDVRKDSLSSDA